MTSYELRIEHYDDELKISSDFATLTEDQYVKIVRFLCLGEELTSD